MNHLIDVKADFPTLQQTINQKPLVYLDSAATTQKPQCVIDALNAYYQNDNANIHRAVYELGQRATQHYEEARQKVASFIKAPESREIIFVRGATEAINLVAHSFVAPRLQPGDEVLITHLEHHANIVPWQLICEQKGALLKVIPVDDQGDLIMDAIPDLISERTRFMAFAHISNALGTVNPVKELCEIAQKHHIPTLIDGAQAIAHTPLDVQALGCDFYVFSGHKLYAPTGIGVLYGRADLLSNMPPYQGGGDMIDEVRFEKTTYAPIPSRFEAGTPHIAGAYGLGIAIDYLQSIGLDKIQAYETDLVEYGAKRLQEVPGLRLIGTPKHRASALSFVIEGAHCHDIGTLLDGYGVSVRVGHHCAQPIMRHFDVSATTRASIGIYNTHADLDHLVESLKRIVDFFL
jgi:cysteine desulfurase/selenocysteine lyase